MDQSHASRVYEGSKCTTQRDDDAQWRWLVMLCWSKASDLNVEHVIAGIDSQLVRSRLDMKACLRQWLEIVGNKVNSNVKNSEVINADHMSSVAKSNNVDWKSVQP